MAYFKDIKNLIDQTANVELYNNKINYISILIRICSLDVINLINNISDDNIPYKHSDLIHISSINKKQLEVFFPMCPLLDYFV